MNEATLETKSSYIAIDYREKNGISKHAFDKSFDEDLEKIATEVNRITIQKRNGVTPLQD